MRKFIILTITACFFAILGASAGNTDNQQKGKALSKAEQLQDYDYFFGKLEEIHPNSYDAFGGKTEFSKAVGLLREKLAAEDSLTLNNMQFEVTKLLSVLHDGHTNMGYPEMPKKTTNAWIPLNLKVIRDGFVVDGWLPQFAFLKGARLQEIEGVPLETLLERLDKIHVTENRYGLLGKACNSLCHNNSLRQILPGFVRDSLGMRFRLSNGGDTLVYVPFYPNGDVWKKFVKSPQDSRFPKKNFEFRFADDKSQTMVMCINSITSADIPNYKDSEVIVAEAFDKMLREMKAAKSKRLIIDLRGNGGGWTMIMYAALYQLYGERFLKTDMGMNFSVKISEEYLKKNNTTIEQFNKANGTSLGIGDFFDEPTGIDNMDNFMCANKNILKELKGKPVYTPKEIFVVTDQWTFSAAFHLAFMMHKMGAKIVGVPSGQAPNTYMECTLFSLPNSGQQCSVSNSIQRCYPDGDKRAQVFTPDIELSYDDYRKFDFNRDAELLYLLKK